MGTAELFVFFQNLFCNGKNNFRAFRRLNSRRIQRFIHGMENFFSGFGKELKGIQITKVKTPNDINGLSNMPKDLLNVRLHQFMEETDEMEFEIIGKCKTMVYQEQDFHEFQKVQW